MNSSLQSDKLSLMRGLSQLMRPGKSSRYWMHLDACHEYITDHDTHPFCLPPIASPLDVEVRRFKFVGAHATDISTMVFLANIRFWLDFPEVRRLSGLRVISMPFVGGVQGQHHIFFEIQTQHDSIISGETTDFSGAGNTARTELEGVFAVLSHVYGVDIVRVNVPRIPLAKLYQEREFA